MTIRHVLRLKKKKGSRLMWDPFMITWWLTGNFRPHLRHPDYERIKWARMNYPAASYGVSKTIVSKGNAASCGELDPQRD
jgi:hypothetical protein